MNKDPIILVVDDYLKNVQVLARILENENYKVAVANDGEMALKIAKKILPNLILLDIKLPGISGYDVCEQLRSFKDTQNTPIFFLSGRSEPEYIEKSKQVGGNDFIIKPFDINQLLSKIKTTLACSV